LLPQGPFALRLGVKPSNEERWCQNHLADHILFELLEKIDQDFAEQTRQEGCWFCQARVHRADYERKPRGGPRWRKRLSFCCSREGCRRRCTPPSVRFLGRRVYAGVIVVLMSAMLHGLSDKRVQRLHEVLAMDRRTLQRWRQWWLENFVRSRFWRAQRGRFMPPVCEATLPRSMVQRFGVGLERRDRLLDLLRFLAPLTAPGSPDAQAF
jgi:hypothetical protein